MKKRLLVLCMAGIMAAGCYTLVMAEEAEESTDINDVLDQVEWDDEVKVETKSGKLVNWSDFEAIASSNEAYAGSFKEDETLGVKYYIPDCMVEKEVTKEKAEDDGYYKDYWCDDKANFYITIRKDDTLLNNKEYFTEIQEQQQVDVSYVEINGLEGVMYETENDKKEKTFTVGMVVPEGGKAIEYNCRPGNADSEYGEMFQIIISSIQPLGE